MQEYFIVLGALYHRIPEQVMIFIRLCHVLQEYVTDMTKMGNGRQLGEGRGKGRGEGKGREGKREWMELGKKEIEDGKEVGLRRRGAWG